MKYKTLSIIGGILIVVLIGHTILIKYSISQYKTNRINKQVAGINNKLPIPDKKAFVRPPNKNNEAIPLNVSARAAILIDVPSSYILYQKNAQEKIPIASTTKIMTATVILEDYSDKLSDVVKITYPMINVEGSDIKLQVNEEITVENLLKGLLIMSGNDTAYSLAEHFGGKEKFVEKMNQKAQFLGLQNTHYLDPAGLNDDGYSTAQDLAIIASYAMRISKFREIVKTSETSVTSVDGNIVHDLKSSNRMIKPGEQLYFPFAIGIKTGFTYAAGHCLVSAAINNNHEILGVVLNTNESSITASAMESKNMLQWGYANWTWLD